MATKKIYTRTGDTGETGLFGGGRVPKDSVRVEAYGQIDELNAAIGLALSLDPKTFAQDLLEQVQRDLFTIGAELATPDHHTLEQALGESTIGFRHVEALEAAIDRHEMQLQPLKNFILPGGASKAAALHVARTVCRRAERALVTLRSEAGARELLLAYVNRLSDLLFVLARAANAAASVPDVKW